MGSAFGRCLALVVLLTGCETNIVALHAVADATTLGFSAQSLGLGWFTTLAVRDGVLYGAGTTSSGELATLSATPATRFRVIDAEHTWVAVQSGLHHGCGLDDAGAVYCWGAGDQGQLGLGDTITHIDVTRVTLPGAAAKIVARDETTCALLQDARLFCWGFNDENGLSQPALSEDVLAPAAMTVDDAGTTLDEFIDVGVGQGHLCVVVRDGGMFCSGRNSEGQIGTTDGGEIQALAFVRVGTANDWWAVSCSQSLSCGLRGGTSGAAGELWCWGDNLNDALVLGTPPESVQRTPVRLGVRTWAKVETNAFDICAINRDNVLACSGRREEGEHGIGDVSSNAPSFDDVFDNVREVAIGRFHTCSITLDDALYCTGRNIEGQLAIGDTSVEERHVWTRVPELSSAQLFVK